MSTCTVCGDATGGQLKCQRCHDAGLEETPGETRATSETGGQKGQKDIRLSQMPVHFLEDVGRVFAFGERKYARGNFLRGYPWSWSMDAAWRHWLAMSRGEWFDAESGLPHIAHVAWHCACLHEFHRRGLGTDDRLYSGGAQ